MFAPLERAAVADRTGITLLAVVTAARGAMYLPYTPDLHYTHPVETVASSSTLAVVWLTSATSLLVLGLISPRSTPTTIAWTSSIVLHVFFGMSMAVALWNGVADSYLSCVTCFCVAGLAGWGSARERPNISTNDETGRSERCSKVLS